MTDTVSVTEVVWIAVSLVNVAVNALFAGEGVATLRDLRALKLNGRFRTQGRVNLVLPVLCVGSGLVFMSMGIAAATIPPRPDVHVTAAAAVTGGGLFLVNVAMLAAGWYARREWLRLKRLVREKRLQRAAVRGEVEP